jgi:hypothetical protein
MRLRIRRGPGQRSDLSLHAQKSQYLVEPGRDRPHPTGGRIVGGKERLEREFRQRDVDRSAENHRGGKKAQGFAIEPYLERDRDIVR